MYVAFVEGSDGRFGLWSCWWTQDPGSCWSVDYAAGRSACVTPGRFSHCLGFCFFSTSLSLARGNSGRLSWVRHSSRRSSATHSYQCVQYFRVSKQWYGCQCLGILTCAHMLMHAIAYWGLRGHRKRVCSGRKIACRTGIRTHVSIAPGFSVGRSIN